MRDTAQATITYITLRKVERGEELCICYGESRRLGFIDTDTKTVGLECEELVVARADSIEGINDLSQIQDVFA